MDTIKILGIGLAVAGAISLVIGIFGLFSAFEMQLSPWAFAIVGFIFFLSGMGLLKRDAGA